MVSRISMLLRDCRPVPFCASPSGSSSEIAAVTCLCTVMSPSNARQGVYAQRAFGGRSAGALAMDVIIIQAKPPVSGTLRWWPGCSGKAKGGAMDLKLKGRRAILAGATKGIGRAAAEALADEGCNIALCARDAARLEGTLAALRAKGVNAIGSSVDLTDPERYKGWVASAAQSLGGCDIFISFASAGGGPP